MEVVAVANLDVPAFGVAVLSLVGNLADLGLADIFQIVSLSRRSGTLQLSTQLESGEIIFLDGRVVAAYRSGSDLTVGEALLRADVVAPTTYQDMLAAEARGLEGVELARRYSLDIDALEGVLKTLMSDVVYAMFEWDDGTFSFVLDRDLEPWNGFSLTSQRAVVSQGVNPQYLAMEGARRRDERQQSDSLSQFLSKEASSAADSPVAASSTIGASFEPYRSEEDPAPQVTAEPVAESRPNELLATEESSKSSAEEPAGRKELGPRVSVEREASTPGSKVIPLFPQRSVDTRSPRVMSVGGAAPKRAPQPPEEWSAVVLDDDPNVLRVLERGLERRFVRVYAVARVSDALRTVEAAARPVVVISDLVVPRSDGRGILGGIELAEQLRATEPDVPIVLFSDYKNPVAEESARKLDVDGVLAKPRRSQIVRDVDDPRPTEPMEGFLRELVTRLDPYLGEVREVDSDVDLGRDFADDIDEIVGQAELELPPRPSGVDQMDMLRSMLAELVNPANRETITLLVLRYADLIVERAALFLVTRDAYIGLGGFSGTEESGTFLSRVRKTHVPTEANVVFDRAVKYGALIRGPIEKTPVNQALMERLGGESTESFVAPLSSGGRVAAVLFGDNPSGEPLGPTDGLEIFLQQAGLAMDRALLERRLEEVRRKRDEED